MSFRRRKPRPAEDIQELSPRHGTIFLSHREYLDLLRQLERRQIGAFIIGLVTGVGAVVAVVASALGLSSWRWAP